jgi:hypothetical protein
MPQREEPCRTAVFEDAPGAIREGDNNVGDDLKDGCDSTRSDWLAVSRQRKAGQVLLLQK